MDKVKIFVERHVQWLVLLVAMLYVGYTVWAYIWNPPLTVKIGKIVGVKPGDVDDKIKATQVVPLLAEIDNKVVSAPKVTDVLTDFDDRLNERHTEIVDMKNQWDAPFGPPGSEHRGPLQGPIVKVAKLPELPPAVFKASSTRRTVLMMPGRKDTTYWSGRFEIDANALAQAVAAAFNNPGIPPNIFRVEFASVELLREEQMTNGTWSAPVMIKPLYILDPYPAVDAKPADKFNFRHWMDQNQGLIASPPFLKTATDAEPWLEPGAPLPDAAQPTRVPGQPPVPRPGVHPDAVDAGPAANPNGQPNGGFNPLLQQANPTILVHDVSIEEGKIYRYAVRYKLYNPLFNNQVFAFPAVANQFEIPSPDPLQPNNPQVAAAWTGAVSIEPSSYVFVTKINQFTGQALFDIFEWKDGHWHPTPAVPNKQLTAGDPISGSKGVSKYMLVDIRKDTRPTEPNYAIVMDGSGGLQFRNVRDDAVNVDYARLKLLAVPGAGPAGPAAAAAAR